MLAKGKQFLFLSNNRGLFPVKVFSVIEERKNIYVEDPLSFKTWLFRNSLQVRDGDCSNLQRLLQHRSNIHLQYCLSRFCAHQLCSVQKIIILCTSPKTNNSKNQNYFKAVQLVYWTNILFLFLQSFIGCTIGIWNVGYVMICYGVVDAVCSISFGRLVQYVGHIPFFALGKFYME